MSCNCAIINLSHNVGCFEIDKEARYKEATSFIISPPHILKMSHSIDFAANNEQYASTFTQGHLPLPPSKKIIVGKLILFTIFFSMTQEYELR